MSDTNNTDAAKPEPAKTPLERLKERQALQRKNLAAKGTGTAPAAPSDATAKTGDVSAKKMRSSASKQGG